MILPNNCNMVSLMSTFKFYIYICPIVATILWLYYGLTLELKVSSAEIKNIYIKKKKCVWGGGGVFYVKECIVIPALYHCTT